MGIIPTIDRAEAALNEARRRLDELRIEARETGNAAQTGDLRDFLPRPNTIYGRDVKGPWGEFSLMSWRRVEMMDSPFVQIRSKTFGTFWHWAGIWWTAAHVHEANAAEIPPFVENSEVVICRPGRDHLRYRDGMGMTQQGYDLAAYGPKSAFEALRAPAPLTEDSANPQSVLISGIPGGSHVPISYTAQVIMDRRNDPSIQGDPDIDIPAGETCGFMLRLQPEAYAVQGGMSGGIVLDERTNLPIGMLVAQAGAADTNDDRIADEHCDIVPLHQPIRHILSELGVVMMAAGGGTGHRPA